MDNTQHRKEVIGNRVRKLRAELGLTLRELGEILGLKGSRISNWEQGTRTPELEEIQNMARYFRVSPAYLAGFTDERGYYEGFHNPLGCAIAISRERLSEKGVSPRATQVMVQRDESLAPAIPMGAEVVIDTKALEPSGECYMAVRRGAVTTIEHVAPHEGGYLIGGKVFAKDGVKFAGKVHMVIAEL
ncbi:MAG: helix-turn-helix domain-containing protein [Aeromonadaceae bacterium]